MTRAFCFACLLSLAACGEVTSGPDGASSASSGGGGSGVGAGGAGTGAGGAGAGGGGSGTGGGECVPQSTGTGGFMEPTCEDLGVLTVTNPAVTDDDGDGLVASGEGAILQVDLNEVAGIGFNLYPGVTFESDHPGVTPVAEDWLYAILACETHPMAAHATFDVPAGTIVTITARVAMLNQDCPDAYAIEFPIEVH